MDKLRTSLMFAVLFTAVEVTVYSLAFVAHSFVFSGGSIKSSASMVASQLLWRAFFGQVLFQLVLLSCVRFFELNRNLAVVLVVVAAAFVASGFITFGNMLTTVQLFGLPTRSALGEGLVILISATITWILFERFVYR